MADQPNQKAQSDQRAAQQSAPTQPAAAQSAPAEKREYVAKHKIRSGGRDARKTLVAGATLRLTEEEAARLGDAVELKR